MELPWYRQYFWLLVFGAIILVIAIISFVMLCFCKKLFSRSLTLHIRRSFKQEKKMTQVQNVQSGSFTQSIPQRTYTLPEIPTHDYETIEDHVTHPNVYSKVKKEPVIVQQHLIKSAYNSHKHDVHLQVPSTSDRYSNASYDSVGHIAYDYGTPDPKNFAKDREYIDVLPDDKDYDDVEII
ncbi:hypothetical protein GDO81_005637 [Engystomops pustulosus]|uniref:SLP adapter and CSK-interacting membrane protein n=1 Tax=Engystomops pustulosus TaxID=76066 RepID=A0AAV7CQH9_ENGPU|nr:hypothetical protein GDO81_005637 [Engystomops pustulosus]KAG8587330.1 hypothetical protein GDO81_005637 [Engystomops pustulosus]